jgi:hypothetical protein
MPEAGFRADVRTLGDYDLAARYAVSLEAVRYRRRLLGV